MKTVENRSPGLPNYYYTDEQILAQELRLLWQHSWLIVGRAEEVAPPAIT
jgi:hypothetical protein